MKKSVLSPQEIEEIAARTGMKDAVAREKEKRRPATNPPHDGFRQAALILRDAIDGRKRT